MMVVCPTSTPATSVIALSGPTGKMPTFSPISEARGRLLDVFCCAKLGTNMRIIKTAIAVTMNDERLAFTI
jgi:hypothetical protein